MIGLGLRRFAHLTVTRVTVVEGVGVVGNPFREVNYYFDAEGALLWNDDRYGPAEYGKLAEFPGWALTKVADALTGQTHNPAIKTLLDAIDLEQARRQVPA